MNMLLTTLTNQINPKLVKNGIKKWLETTKIVKERKKLKNI